jgi:thiamine biosynthesis lipoprotein
MMATSQQERRLADLAELGFERVRATPVSLETVSVDRRICKVIATKPAMGTLVSLSLLARSQDQGEMAVGRALEQMDRLITVFDRYDGASAVSQLNQAGLITAPPPELKDLISRAVRYHKLSAGGFDISVAPVVDLFKNRLRGEPPTGSEVCEALELVGTRHIEVSRRHIGFARSGMRVTLDGIAKGHIVDAMARVLEQCRVKNYLIEAGGDIRVRGTREQRRPWTVAVQDPGKSGLFPDVVELNAGAVATSGAYEASFDAAGEHHHIVHSHSGRSPQHSSSVSVLAPNAMAADALATTVFLLEPRRGIEFVANLAGCECLVVERDGGVLKSPGWPSAEPTSRGKAEA